MDRENQQELYFGQSLRDVLKNLSSGKMQTPFVLLQLLHEVFPQFAQRGEGGALAQQDANECWTELISLLRRIMPTTGTDTAKKTVIDRYLRITSAVTLRNSENKEEAPQESEEIQYQLSCFISQEVKYLESGLRLRLSENLTKSLTNPGKGCCVLERIADQSVAHVPLDSIRSFLLQGEGRNQRENSQRHQIPNGFRCVRALH